MLFHQVVGDGASIFMSIVAVVIGFGVAMGFVDFKKTQKSEHERDSHHHPHH